METSRIEQILNAQNNLNTAIKVSIKYKLHHNLIILTYADSVSNVIGMISNKVIYCKKDYPQYAIIKQLEDKLTDYTFVEYKNSPFQTLFGQLYE